MLLYTAASCCHNYITFSFWLLVSIKSSSFSFFFFGVFFCLLFWVSLSFVCKKIWCVCVCMCVQATSKAHALRSISISKLCTKVGFSEQDSWGSNRLQVFQNKIHGDLDLRFSEQNSWV